jgi:hypothetical protein
LLTRIPKEVVDEVVEEEIEEVMEEVVEEEKVDPFGKNIDDGTLQTTQVSFMYLEGTSML